MKKILFLLLFLQADLVFGQMKLLDNYRSSTFEIPDLYSEEYFITANKKKVKKVEVERSGVDLINGTYDENGKIEFIEIYSKSVQYRIYVGYNKAGLVESEITESSYNGKDFKTAHEYLYFRFKNSKDSLGNLLCLEMDGKDIIGISTEKICQNSIENYRILINSEKFKLNIKDTAQIIKLIEHEEALKNYHLKNLTQYSIMKYEYEKDKLLSVNLKTYFGENQNRNIEDKLQYITEKSGYVFQDGKLANIFFIESNGNYYNPLYAQTKIQSNIKYKLDDCGNWIVKLVPYIDGKDELKWFTIKRKIQYYD